MATKKLGVYKCDICGNIVEVINNGAGDLVCCGQNMNYMEENTVDAATEKHVPVAKVSTDGIKVAVGSVEHPMVQEHYIEWIELVSGNNVCRKELKPGEKPETFFPAKPEQYTLRAYCNLHGLWKGE